MNTSYGPTLSLWVAATEMISLNSASCVDSLNNIVTVLESIRDSKKPPQHLHAVIEHVVDLLRVFETMIRRNAVRAHELYRKITAVRLLTAVRKLPTPSAKLIDASESLRLARMEALRSGVDNVSTHIQNTVSTPQPSSVRTAGSAATPDLQASASKRLVMGIDRMMQQARIHMQSWHAKVANNNVTPSQVSEMYEHMIAMASKIDKITSPDKYAEPRTANIQIAQISMEAMRYEQSLRQARINKGETEDEEEEEPEPPILDKACAEMQLQMACATYNQVSSEEGFVHEMSL